MTRPEFAFQWHITDECDQRCRHCYIFSGEARRSLLQTPWQQMLKAVDACLEMCERFQRRPHFYLTGGDPLLHPDFWRLAESLHGLKLDFTVLGNPFHLDEAVCARLRELGCVRYQMSLDGLRETHDWFRKPGSYDCTMEKLPLLRQAGIETAIMSTVSARNIAEIPALIHEAVNAGVSVYAFARYCPERGKGENGIAPLEYRKLLERCDSIYQKYEQEGCGTAFARKDHLWTLYYYETGRFRIPEDAEPDIIYGGCNCGNCHLTILPNGDVYACRRLPSRVGNVFEDDLTHIWLEDMEAYRDYSAFEKCSRCKLLPYCRGCPAVAYSATGSFYGADPQCWAADGSLH